MILVVGNEINGACFPNPRVTRSTNSKRKKTYYNKNIDLGAQKLPLIWML